MDSADDNRTPTDLKACMNFKWTDDLTMQFILYRHERRQTFTKKRNTSRQGWQQILRDMGLSAYVTPYQAQKKWNNILSRYKMAKKALAEGVPDNDPNSAWPFFTVLDAIASGKNVTISNPAATSTPSSATTSAEDATVGITDSTQTEVEASCDEADEPAANISKTDESDQHLLGESAKNVTNSVVELLHANLKKLDEIKESIETQGQNIVSMLAQLIHVISTGNKSPSTNSRINDAITESIREIGISQEHA